MFVRQWIGIVLLLLIAPRVAADDVGPASANSVRDRVAPILVQRCLACHGTKVESGYSLMTPAKWFEAGDSELVPIVAGKPDASELWRRLVSEDAELRMPPDADRLTETELNVIKDWIEEGAKVDASDLNLPLSALVARKASVAPEHYPRALPIHVLALLPGTNDALVGGYAEVTRWELSKGELRGRFPAAGAHVIAIAVSADGKRAAVSSGTTGLHDEVRLVQLNEGSFDQRPLATYNDTPAALGFAPDSQRLAIGTQEGRLQIIESLAIEPTVAMELTPHADAVLGLAWSADSERLVTSSRDRTAKLFDANKLDLIASYDRHERAVGGAGFLKTRPLSLDETGRVRWMAGDDSDAVVAEQGGLPRTLQPVVISHDELLVHDANRIRRFTLEKKTVDNGKDSEGKAKTKEVTRFRELAAIELPADQWITALAANESSIVAGTQHGMLFTIDRSTSAVLKSFLAKP